MRFSNPKYLFYKSNRRQLATVSSMVANIALGVVHIVLSLVEMSLFLGFSGAFHITMALGKFYALERLLRLKTVDEKVRNAAECKSIDKINFCTLISSALFFCFGIVIIFFYEDPAHYDIWMIFYITAATIIKIITFIFSAIVILRKKNRVKYYVKLMSAASALISLALMQRAILYYIDAPYPSVFSGIGGIFFSLLATFVGLYMLHKSIKQKQYLLEHDLIDEKSKEEILKKQKKRKITKDKWKNKLVTIKSWLMRKQ